jgi:hypothetical protein
VSVIQDAVLYSGPGKDGYEEIAPLAVGTNVEPLGIFVDFVLVRLYGADKPQEGYIPAVMLGDVPQDLPTLTDEQVPWKVYKSLATEDMPLEVNHPNSGWSVNTLAKNLKFSGPFQIEINMQSQGINGIILVSTKTGPRAWSASGANKSIEFFYESGILNVHFNDNSQEEYSFTYSIPLPNSKNGVTTGEILVKFDQYGKRIQVFRENKPVYDVLVERVGDFSEGLFPDGKILSVKLASGDIGSVKITKLIFYVPPDGKYK